MGELVASARHAAGDSDLVLVEPANEPVEEVIKGSGAAFDGAIASGFFLVPRRRFQERFEEKPFSIAAEKDEVPSLAPMLAQSLHNAQLALVTDDFEAAQLEPVLQRLASRKHSACVVGRTFSPASLETMVVHHQQAPPGCVAFAVSREMMAAVRALGGRFRRHTGFFGLGGLELSLAFEVAEVRQNRLLLFNSSRTFVTGLAPAALIRIGRMNREETADVVRAVRQALLAQSTATR